MAITNNLYPPIMLDSLPAADRTQTRRVYFSLSNYNSKADIASINGVQVSIINQKTNTSALKKSQYPSGIVLASIKQDNTISNDFKYYIEIPTNILEKGLFELNQFYKIQLRFISNEITPPTDINAAATSTWLTNNLDYFSEWSTVTLIKGIQPPQIYLKGFEDDGDSNIFSTSEINLIGKLFYSNNTQETEYLKSYVIKLYKKENEVNNLVFESKQIYTNPYAPNEINYELQQLEDGGEYLIRLDYKTNNFYEGTIEKTFSIVLSSFNAPKVTVNTSPDEENGRIQVKVTFLTKFLGNLTIRRTSSKSNFRKWQDIKNFFYDTKESKEYKWYDMTIESGIWYKYCVQERDSEGNRSAIVQSYKPVICNFEHIFLMGDNRQLKIQFNPNIGDFKYNVTESQQTTIGAKYPFIKRNSNNYFRSFSIGGLISSLSEFSNWYDPNFYNGIFYENKENNNFITKSEIYNKSLNLYENFNSQNQIFTYDDFIYEKEFREKVYDFLYENNVKLFRSAAEGNILIKLLNISFQPLETLGRRLYSFTATAVEVDESTISNYNKYNIQNIGEYQTFASSTFEVLGQVTVTGSINVISSINNKYSNKAADGYTNTVKRLKWVRIQIESPPPIVSNTGNSIAGCKINVRGAGNTNSIEMVIPIRKRTFLDGKKVNTLWGFLEFKGKDVDIIALNTVTSGCTYRIDYIAEIETTKKQNSSQPSASQIKNSIYFQKIGQLYGIFAPNQSMISQIFNKQTFNYPNEYYQQLLNVTGIEIEVPKNTIAYIKDSRDTNLNRHILKDGYLQLKDEDVNIEGLYFSGIHFNQNEIIQIPHIYNNLQQIENPILNGVYKISSNIIDLSSMNGVGQFSESKTNYVHNVNGSRIQNSYKTGVLTVDWADVEKLYSQALAFSKNNKIRQVNKLYTLILSQLISNSTEVGGRYIYYNGEWYLFTEQNDILCPIDGIVNYTCEIVKGYYK